MERIIKKKLSPLFLISLLIVIFLHNSCDSRLIILLDEYNPMMMYLAGNYICVSETTGNDANPGTKEAPKETIQAGIQQAIINGYITANVLVAEGVYEEDYRTSGLPVATLSEGISIYGGFDISFTERNSNPFTNNTEIMDLSNNGGTGVDPNHALHGGTAVTNATIVDGFTIDGPIAGSTYGTAIYINNSSPTVQNCNIHGGLGETTSGIYIIGLPSAPRISNNTIDGGDANLNPSANSNGIILSGAGGIIEYNDISGGDNGPVESRGIYSINSNYIINNNMIYSGLAVVDTGIYSISDANIDITNNSISFSPGTTNTGLYMSDSSGTVIQNTITGNSGTNNTCINIVNNSDPTISQNTINSGNPLRDANGIVISNSNPIVTYNTISNTSGEDIYGINIDNNSVVNIENNSIQPGTATEIYYGILCLTNTTGTIQNNTIQIGTSLTDSTYGIRRENSDVNLEGNTINAGTGNLHIFAIYNLSSNGNIINNDINGGIANGSNTYCIYNDNCSPTIQGNIIMGGNSITANSFGIYNENSSPEIYNNIINGGRGEIRTYGIYEDASNSTIRNNTIDGGENSLDSTYAIYLDDTNGNATIENNILFTTSGTNRYGIFESPTLGSSDPNKVRNNDIFDCPDGLYYDDDTATYITLIADVNNLDGAGTDYENNISIDPQFQNRSGGNFHLTASTPASVHDGGINGADEAPVWIFNQDFDTIVRPASGNPWAIGAYEQ